MRFEIACMAALTILLLSGIASANTYTLLNGTNVVGLPGLSTSDFASCNLKYYDSRSNVGCSYRDNGYFVYYNPDSPYGDCDSNFFSSGSMSDGLGYYVSANNSCTIQFTPKASMDVTLYPGTNVISLPVMTTADQIASVCGGAKDTIFKYYDSRSNPGCRYSKTGYFVYYNATNSSGDCGNNFHSSSLIFPNVGYYVSFQGKAGNGDVPCVLRFINGLITEGPTSTTTSAASTTSSTRPTTTTSKTSTSTTTTMASGGMRIGVTYYGNYQDWSGISDTVLNRDFALFKSKGVSLIILPTFWQTLESSRGTYDSATIGRLKHITDVASVYGIKVVHNIHTWYTGTNVPSYVGNQRITFTDVTKKADWLNFVRYFVSSLDGTNVEGFQLCNELGMNQWTSPNSINYDGSITYDQYYAWMGDTYQAARSQTSKPLGCRWAMLEATTTMLESRVVSVWDYVGLNYYDGIDTANTPAKFAETVSRLKTLGKPIWVTEYGVATTDNTAQADRYTTDLALFKSNGISTAVNWWWSGLAGVGTTSYNVADGSGNPRPAFNILAGYAQAPSSTTTTSTYTTTTIIAGATYTFSIAGQTISVKNPSGSVIKTGSDFGAVFNYINSILQVNDRMHIIAGIYPVSSFAKLTKQYITVDSDAAVYLSGQVGLNKDPLMIIQGSHNVINGINFVDNYRGGVTGAVILMGSYNTVSECSLDECDRYGFVTDNADHFALINNRIIKAQYGISGSDGYIPNPWSSNGLVSGNIIGDVNQCGIKMKMWKDVMVTNNTIDVGYKEWENPSFNNGQFSSPSSYQTYGAVGIRFYHADTPTQNVIVIKNTIVDTTRKYPKGAGILVDADTHGDWANCPYAASGEKILNNTVSTPWWGLIIQHDGVDAEYNDFSKVTGAPGVYNGWGIDLRADNCRLVGNLGTINNQGTGNTITK
jgi:hypothetical protein